MANHSKAVAGGFIARLAACASLAMVLAGALAPAAAEEAGIKGGARNAGHAAEEGGKEFQRALKGKSD